MDRNESRRSFFKGAAKVGACISASSMIGSLVALEPSLSAQPSSKPSFVSLPASELETLADGLRSQPGTKYLVDSEQLPFNARVVSQRATSGKEFEFHEHTDHVFQVLEGKTHFQVGGTPENAHLIKPGEWMAPESKGSTAVDMTKGDIIVIPRGTPHKQTTEESVVLWMIFVTGPTPS